MLKDGFKSEQFQISIDSCEILQGADIMYFETYSSTIFQQSYMCIRKLDSYLRYQEYFAMFSL